MKTLVTIIFLAMFSWSAPVAAKFCNVNEAENKTLCRYKATRLPDNAQIFITYTDQGFSMMIVIFLEEFAMVEGDARMKTKKGEMQTLEYVTTHHDMTPEGLMMEAGVYKVTESMLRELGNARGKVRFWLPANDTKDQQLKIAASKFSELEEYIEETKSTLGL
ncbi:MAG: hypothetical protein HKP21_14040 [Xanthomonadales bacterium]|nr:hypothetical protein [Gammaproteobacteria bacterium]MBT8074816.1 hypothetical protein [Gammaproteobacteria bacterium]NNK05668.1 hypothetical protein [Xanthomonadales bacterium]NNK97652.1 hypothetical protein [Xanthomonadales bacterium]